MVEEPNSSSLVYTNIFIRVKHFARTVFLDFFYGQESHIINFPFIPEKSDISGTGWRNKTSFSFHASLHILLFHSRGKSIWHMVTIWHVCIFFQGIVFADFKSFGQFLNSLDDFAVALKMYNFADQPVSQGMFWLIVYITFGVRTIQLIGPINLTIIWVWWMFEQLLLGRLQADRDQTWWESGGRMLKWAYAIGFHGDWTVAMLFNKNCPVALIMGGLWHILVYQGYLAISIRLPKISEIYRTVPEIGP